ncbi:hypothetical protein D3C72_1947410 [compost metagenome]
MRRPLSSNTLVIAPVRLRLVASGLIIENVRSIAMCPFPFPSEKVGGLYPPKGPKTRGINHIATMAADISRRCHTAASGVVEVKATFEPVTDGVVFGKQIRSGGDPCPLQRTENDVIRKQRR